MNAPLSDVEVCGTFAKLIDALPPDDLLNRMRLSSLFQEFARLQASEKALTAELARRPRVILCAVADVVPTEPTGALGLVRE